MLHHDAGATCIKTWWTTMLVPSSRRCIRHSAPARVSLPRETCCPPYACMVAVHAARPHAIVLVSHVVELHAGFVPAYCPTFRIVLQPMQTATQAPIDAETETHARRHIHRPRLITTMTHTYTHGATTQIRQIHRQTKKRDAHKHLHTTPTIPDTEI